MTVIIIMGALILYATCLGFTWHNLGDIQEKTKLIYLIVGILISLVITLIIFYISTNGVDYQNENMIKDVRNILVLVFTPINGLVVMPFIASTIDKLSNQEITREKANKRILIIAIIFIVFLIIECSYLKNTQIGILEIRNG